MLLRTILGVLFIANVNADEPVMLLEEVVVVGATDSDCKCKDIELPEDDYIQDIPVVEE